MLPNIRIDDIEAAIKVAEYKHFARAGKDLHLDQTTISKCMRRVERAIGAKLIDRSAHPVQPTKAGAVFLYWGRKGLYALERGMSEVRRLSEPNQSVLHIGYTSYLDFAVLAYIERTATESGPAFHLKEHSSSTSEIISCVQAGKWNCGFIVTPAATAGLVGIPIYEEPFGFVVARDDPLARRRQIAFGDLRGLRLILPARERNVGFRAWFVQRCAAEGVKPTISHEVGNPHEAWFLASQHAGLALMPKSASINLPKGTTVFRPLLEEDLHATIQLVFRNEPRSPMLASFVDSIPVMKESLRHESEARDRV